MADEHGDYLYSQWMQRKASAMRRPVLSCGCRNDGRSTYVRGTCDCIVCREHRDEEHEHAEEPKKVEALRPARFPGWGQVEVALWSGESVEALQPVDLSLGGSYPDPDLSHGDVEYCVGCEEAWPCKTIKVIASALGVVADG